MAVTLLIPSSILSSVRVGSSVSGAGVSFQIYPAWSVVLLSLYVGAKLAGLVEYFWDIYHAWKTVLLCLRDAAKCTNAFILKHFYKPLNFLQASIQLLVMTRQKGFLWLQGRHSMFPVQSPLHPRVPAETLSHPVKTWQLWVCLLLCLMLQWFHKLQRICHSSHSPK